MHAMQLISISLTIKGFKFCETLLIKSILPMVQKFGKHVPVLQALSTLVFLDYQFILGKKEIFCQL